MSLLPGYEAPDFILRDQYGIPHQLSHYYDTWVILCFMPNGFNSSCIKEACQLRDDFALIQDRQAELFVINLDGTRTHSKFSERYRLTFPILSDKTGKVCEQFDTLWSWGPLKAVRRHSVIINPTGHVVRIYRRVTPQRHSKQLVQDLDLLRQTFIPTRSANLA